MLANLYNKCHGGKNLQRLKNTYNMQPVKLGIIGCGIAATELHWPALQKLREEFKVTAVCNHTEEKAKIFSKLAGDIPYVLNYEDLLKRDDVEAVDIALPIHLNYSVVKDSLNAGKHVIVEKPLAANLSEASEMVQLEENLSLVTMVAENYRYRSVFKKIKLYIDEGRIGIPYSVFWNCFDLMDLDNKYAKTKWRIQHQYPGGFLTDGGIHYIAALRDVFGEIIDGRALLQSINPDIGKLDSMIFQFVTENKIQSVLNLFFSAKGYSENRLIILGKEGSILFEEDKLILRSNRKIVTEETFKNDNGYKEEFLNFFMAIRIGQKVKSSFSEGYKDLKTMIELLNSSASITMKA